MATESRFESAGFWVAMGGALATLGGIFVAVGAVEATAGNPPKVQLWNNIWFVIGIVIALLGIVALLLACGLAIKHALAGRKRASTLAPVNPTDLPRHESRVESHTKDDITTTDSEEIRRHRETTIHVQPGNLNISAKSEPRIEDVMRRMLELLEAQHELTKQQLQARTEATPETIERAVEGLRAEGRIRLRSTAKGQVIQVVGTAIETDQAMPITPMQGPPSDRGPVTRRETVYDQAGREAGEEIVHETRDAIAKPKSVESKAGIPSPTVIGGNTLSVTPDFPKASIQQGDRPGWRAWCELGTPYATSFANGVWLHLQSEGEGAAGIRCRVRFKSSTPGRVYDKAPHDSVFAADTDAHSDASVHFPDQFPNSPTLEEGDYEYDWIGDPGDLFDPQPMKLAGGTFKVNNLGIPYCPPKSAS